MLLVFLFSPALRKPIPPPPYPPPEDQKCNEYIQIYAEPDTYYAEPYQKLDLICPKDYRAISCEAEIKSEGAYYQYFVTPYGYPQTYVLDEQVEVTHRPLKTWNIGVANFTLTTTITITTQRKSIPKIGRGAFAATPPVSL